MNSRTKVIHIDGIVGAIEMSIDLPDELKIIQILQFAV